MPPWMDERLGSAMRAREHVSLKKRRTSCARLIVTLVAVLVVAVSPGRADETRPHADVTLHDSLVFRLYRGDGGVG